MIVLKNLKILYDSWIKGFCRFTKPLFFQSSQIHDGSLSIDKRPKITSMYIQMYLCDFRAVKYFLCDPVKKTFIFYFQYHAIPEVFVPLQAFGFYRNQIQIIYLLFLFLFFLPFFFFLREK